MIEVEGLKKSFYVHKKAPGLLGSVKALFRRESTEKVALDNVSLTINAGEIVGLIGANGAGKTTLVKLLSGIVHPTSGSARVLGFVPWERKNDFRRQIALIMGQKAQLWWDLPAEDCFLLLKEIYQIDDTEFEARKNRLTAILGVEKQLNIQIRKLSLGERMKMELMAALLHNPRVVFLDEPTIGLDLTAQRAIRQFIRDYQAEYKPAMILTSHYMEDIEKLCERIIIMQEGRIVYDGPLQEVVRSYASTKVLTAHFSPEEVSTPIGLEKWGEVLSRDEGSVRLKIPRDRVTAVAAEILTQYSLSDLEIEETDISDIIESLLRKKKGP